MEAITTALSSIVTSAASFLLGLGGHRSVMEKRAMSYPPPWHLGSLPAPVIEFSLGY